MVCGYVMQKRCITISVVFATKISRPTNRDELKGPHIMPVLSDSRDDWLNLVYCSGASPAICIGCP